MSRHVVTLTHLLQVMHLCINWVSIGSDNGLSPIRRHAISQPVLGYCQWDPLEQTSMILESKYKTFHLQKCI